MLLAKICFVFIRCWVRVELHRLVAMSCHWCLQSSTMEPVLTKQYHGTTGGFEHCENIAVYVILGLWRSKLVFDNGNDSANIDDRNELGLLQAIILQGMSLMFMGIFSHQTADLSTINLSQVGINCLCH